MATRHAQPLMYDQAQDLTALILQALTAKFAHGAALSTGPDLVAARRADDHASAALWRGFYALVDPEALCLLVDQQARQTEEA